jgi:hypothetical protein
MDSKSVCVCIIRFPENIEYKIDDLAPNKHLPGKKIHET